MVVVAVVVDVVELVVAVTAVCCKIGLVYYFLSLLACFYFSSLYLYPSPYVYSDQVFAEKGLAI